MVEIGPGLGAITLPLLARLPELHAVEIDRDAIRHLRAASGESAALHLHEADVLEFDFATLDDGRGLRVVGNLPYNISTPLLFRLIEQREHIRDMHFMLQKEVVDRMAAAPDRALRPADRHARAMAAGRAVVRHRAGAFRPPPRVVSTFVRLAPHAEPLRIEQPRCYANVVAAAFSQRRKTLRNALKALLSQEEIRAAGIDPGARAETVPAAGFAALAAQLARKTGQASDSS